MYISIVLFALFEFLCQIKLEKQYGEKEERLENSVNNF